MKNETSSYLDNISLLLLGVLLIFFPILFAPFTTEFFGVPKQAAFIGITFILLILASAKMVSDKAVRLRRTPYDIPLLFLGGSILLSSIFAVNRYDSLIASLPMLTGILLYFLIVNTAKTPAASLLLRISLIIGAVAVAVHSVSAFLKFYPFPIEATRVQTFSPVGSLLEEAVFLAIALPLTIASIIQNTRKTQHTRESDSLNIRNSDTPILRVFWIVATVVIAIGLSISIYKLVALQKPLLLPFETGFQTAFAAISQDTGRIIQGFFLGSGFGTYLVDFTRFKQPVFNLHETLWSVLFLRSSSFVLELLATTGVLGISSFIFLVVKIIKSMQEFGTKLNPLSVSMLLLLVAAFVLPFSFVLQAVLLILLALFAVSYSLLHKHAFFDVEVHVIASKRGAENAAGWFPFPSPFGKFLPVTIFLVSLILVGFFGFFAVRYVIADVLFRNSFTALSANNGLAAYNDQTNAIRIFPYRDSLYRVYGRTNLALANSIASSQPQGASPSAQTQQTISTLIQQSINAGRQATALSPQTALNWEAFSSIYRSLIGFGQNADQFAILMNQQAIQLDPTNPIQYVNLGGIYYQLQQWDNAQRQFQIAISLKRDYANAYYNLGHVLENKGDVKGALVQYQTAKTLLAADKQASEKIAAEIAALEQKVSGGETGTAPSGEAGSGADGIGISSPQTQLPEQNPPVKIPAPQVGTASATR